jgi:hypothetical protein
VKRVSLILVILTALSAMAFTSCKKEEPAPEPEKEEAPAEPAATE